MVVSFDARANDNAADNKARALNFEIRKNRLSGLVSSGMKCSIKSENNTPSSAIIRQVKDLRSSLLLTCDLCGIPVDAMMALRI